MTPPPDPDPPSSTTGPQFQTTAPSAGPSSAGTPSTCNTQSTPVTHEDDPGHISDEEASLLDEVLAATPATTEEFRVITLAEHGALNSGLTGLAFRDELAGWLRPEVFITSNVQAQPSLYLTVSQLLTKKIVPIQPQGGMRGMPLLPLRLSVPSGRAEGADICDSFERVHSGLPCDPSHVPLAILVAAA